MKLGNLDLNVDSEKIYTSDEMCDILLKNSEGLNFASVLLDFNTLGFSIAPVPGKVVKNIGNTFRLSFTENQLSDIKEYLPFLTSEDLEKVFEINPGCPAEIFDSDHVDNWKILVYVYKDTLFLNVSYSDEDAQYTFIYLHLKTFLEVTEINTFGKLKEEVENINKMYTSLMKTSASPFNDEDILYANYSDFYDFESYKKTHRDN